VALKERPYQRDIGRAGHQEPDGQVELHALAEGMKRRFHGGKHPAILDSESRGFFLWGFMCRLRLRRRPNRTDPDRFRS
jgi:hypothetical protein